MVSSGFSGQAKYQAEMLNLSDVRVSFVRHPISDATPQEMVSKAEESWSAASSAIASNAVPEAPAWVTGSSQDCAT